MRHFVVLAVVSLLLHGYLVEGQGNSTGSGTLPPGATPAGSAATCHACTANVSNSADPCFSAPTGSGSACPNGVCIVVLQDDANGDPVSFERSCNNLACTTDNDNSVFSQAAGGGTSYEKCCDGAADCNTFSADDLRNTAGKLTAGLAAIFFGAIFLLVL
ncbi:uncharacterized protein [Branchiostoma lanceolatum]|uniref:uncharacterized protein n=1 Tax=Branchiostoma lanceolatum TaxID=7740 RepID=UPI003452F591